MKTRSDALPRVGAGLRAYGRYNDGKRNSQGRARGRQAPRARRQRRRVEEGPPPRQARSQHVCEGRKTLPSTNNIGSLPIAFSLTTGTAKVISVDLTNQSNVFCGFSRDATSTLTNCFEGAKDGACPRNIQNDHSTSDGHGRKNPGKGRRPLDATEVSFSPDFPPCLAR